MNTGLVILCSILYVGFIFIIAYYADKQAERGRGIVNNAYIYALSLAVYCTAWTFFGSVGRAATSGFGFLPIYLGPTLIAPLWIIVLRKIIIISKSQRITSIADFISARYGKSTTLGMLATLIALIGIVPYISIQLKAISIGFDILTTKEDFLGQLFDGSIFFRDPALLVSLILATFVILFGTRKLDPNEQHQGLIAAIAFESIIKLLAFLAVGFFVTYMIYDGFGDIFQKAMDYEQLQHLISLESAGIDNFSWMLLIILSMLAVMFLPRQFHLAVVENTNPNFVNKAAWLFPLYLFLINLFVLPIAFGGVMHFVGTSIEPDSFVLNLPLVHDYNLLALLVFLGGFSAASGMIIVAVIALSIMISNNLVTPLLLKSVIGEDKSVRDLSKRLLGIRRVSIIVVLLLAYGYFKSVSYEYSLVSIGLISFTAVAQFAPPILGGIYWKRATKKAAIAALTTSFVVWMYTLPLPTLAEVGILNADFLTTGLFGLKILKPYALFGLEGLDKISHAFFWTMFFNISVLIVVSLYTKPTPLEITQADLFVHIYKYQSGFSDLEGIKREANIQEIIVLLYRFLGEERSQQIIKAYEQQQGLRLSKMTLANADLINYAEAHLTGALGAASAKVVIASIVKEDPISLEEMLKILDQTQEIVQYSKALEKKSTELEETTKQLQLANARLKELDQLKADFITTVTHELRTPITSIRSLANILADNRNLSTPQQKKFLKIIVSESERISRLINQVLDLEKTQTIGEKWQIELVNMNQILSSAYQGFVQTMEEKGIQHQLSLPKEIIFASGNTDKLTQVIVNLGANAIKFSQKGDTITFLLSQQNGQVLLKISDTGIGIPKGKQALIFERFTQVNDEKLGKPHGSGLGLFISKRIVQRHGGSIEVESQENKGTTFTVKIPLH